MGSVFRAMGRRWRIRSEREGEEMRKDGVEVGGDWFFAQSCWRRRGDDRGYVIPILLYRSSFPTPRLGSSGAFLCPSIFRFDISRRSPLQIFIASPNFKSLLSVLPLSIATISVIQFHRPFLHRVYIPSYSLSVIHYSSSSSSCNHPSVNNS